MSDITHFLRDLLPGGSDIFDMGASALGLFGVGGPSPGIGGPGPPVVSTPAPLPTIPAQPPGGLGPMTVGGSCEADPRKMYDMKFICGEWKWVKKRRRRRKRLATSSDIKDLSSLKGVLGGGKSFDLWIATHAN